MNHQLIHNALNATLTVQLVLASYNCQACADPNKSLFQNECVEKCPLGYSCNRKSKKCQKCGNNCMECINENKCTKCYRNFQLKTQFISEQDINILDIKLNQIIVLIIASIIEIVCPNFTEENQDTMTCDNLSPCSTVQDLNLVYHESYVWGIFFDPQIGYFISYDQSVVIFNMDTKCNSNQKVNLSKNLWLKEYLVSYDESVLALWDLKQFNLIKSINLQNNFKISNSKTFVFDQYFVGLNQQGYYQKINFFTDYDNMFVFNITDFGLNSYISFYYTNQKQFLKEPSQRKVKQSENSQQGQPIFQCQKYPTFISSLYYEASINAVFIYGYKGLNVIFLDNIQKTSTCFLDNFLNIDEGIVHLNSLDIASMIVSYTNFQSINIDQYGNFQSNNSSNIDQSRNGIIEFIVVDLNDRIWKYQLDCIKQTIIRINKKQIDSFQDIFWDQNENITQTANRYVVKDTYIFCLLNSKKLLQLNSQLMIINSNFTVNPLNLYNAVRIKDLIITYDIQMDIYNLNSKLEFVIQSIVNSVKNSEQIFNYLQQQPQDSLTNPIYIYDYALNLKGQFLQLWQLPSYKLINQVLLPFDSSQLLPYYYIIQNAESIWNNCIIISYELGSYFYKYPTLEQIIYYDMNSVYSIQTQNNILICSSNYMIYIFDIAQNIQLIQQLNCQHQYSSIRAILYYEYIIFQDTNQVLLIFDIKNNTKTPFKNYNLLQINLSSSQQYIELIQSLVISQILYLFSFDPYYILILDNGHIQFFNVPNDLIQDFNQFDNYFIFYALMQDQFFILKSSNQILAILDCKQLKLIVSFYETSSQVQYIFYDEEKGQIVLNTKQGGLFVIDCQGQITIVKYPQLSVSNIDYLVNNEIQISGSVDFQYSEQFFIFVDTDSILYIFNSTNFELMKKFLVHEIFDIAIILNNSMLMSYNIHYSIIFQTLPDLNLLSILTNTNIIQCEQYIVDNKYNILFQVIAPGQVIAIDLNQFKTLAYYTCIFGYKTYLQIDSEKQHLLFSSTSIFIFNYSGQSINTLNHDIEVAQFIIDQECQVLISYTFQGFIQFWDYQNGKQIITLNFQPDSISLIYLDNIFNQLLRKQIFLSNWVFNQCFTVIGQNIVYYDSRSNYVISALQSEQYGLYVIENLGMIGVSQINNQFYSNNYKNQLYFKQNQKLNIFSFSNNTQVNSTGNLIQVQDTFYLSINQKNIKSIFLYTQQERLYYNKDSGEIAELIINFQNKTQQENILQQNNFFQGQNLIKMSVYENYNLSSIILLIQTQTSITLFYINDTSNQQIQNYQQYNLTYFQNSNIANIKLYSEEYYKYSNQKHMCNDYTNPCYNYLAILANNGSSIDEKKKGELTTFQVIRMILYKKIDLLSEKSSQEESINDLKNQQQQLFSLKNIRLRTIRRLSQKEDLSLLLPSKLQSFHNNKSIDDQPNMNFNYGNSPEYFKGQIQKVKKSQKFNNIFLKSNSLNGSPLLIFNLNHGVQEKLHANNLIQNQSSFNSTGDLNLINRKDSTKINKIQTTDSQLEMQNLSQFSIQLVEDSTSVPQNQNDTRNNPLNYDILAKQSFSKISSKKSTNFSISDQFSPIKWKK
ncbi:hypothetical protein ABPG72_005478 [Tetrahymena utriculariae]